MKKDPNYAVKVEQAIAKKYGKETVQNPKSSWDDDKEKKYLSQIKEFYTQDPQQTSERNVDGVLISEKLLIRESNRSCPICITYSFKSIDDVYMSKFNCCYKCYIQWIDGREERWEKGWRPNNENNHKKT